QGENWKKIGLNLDGIDTQPPDLEVECTSIDPRDGDDGIDNKLGQGLLPSLLITPALLSLPCELELSFERGRGTMLLRIENWNGEANDSTVTASLVSAVDAISAPADSLDSLAWEGTDLLLSEGGEPAPHPC